MQSRLRLHPSEFLTAFRPDPTATNGSMRQ